MQSIQEVLNRLSPDLQAEVSDFAQFLLEKQAKHKNGKKKPNFSWEGALKAAYPQSSSVDLQHEILKARSSLT